MSDAYIVKCLRCDKVVADDCARLCEELGGDVCVSCELELEHLRKCQEIDVDAYESPNQFPYKKCAACSERKSCGSYNTDQEWLCETCAEPECEGCGVSESKECKEDCSYQAKKKLECSEV